MNIIEATKQAMEQGKGIINSDLEKFELYLLPTNTTECFLVIPFGFNVKQKRRAACRWNPHAGDILRDDWELWE